MKFLKVFSELSVPRLVVVSIVATLAYFYFYYDNGSVVEEQITQAKSGLDAEKAKKVEIQKRVRKEEEMKGNILQLAGNLKVVKDKIPNEFNEIEVSSIVNKASEVSQVKLTALKRSTTPSTLSAEQKIASGAELVDEVTFDIEMSGSFHGIIAFVEYLSKEVKTIKIRNFILEKNVTNLTDDTTIKFKGEIVGYKQSKAPGVK